MEKTLAIIKPDAVKNGHVGAILKMIEESDVQFRILALKTYRLDRNTASQFYNVHRQKSFFDSLVTFMSSGPIIVACLSASNAVNKWRNLIGDTNPATSEQGTIRQKFGQSIEANAVHGSDSPENANQEIGFFFKPEELL